MTTCSSLTCRKRQSKLFLGEPSTRARATHGHPIRRGLLDKPFMILQLVFALALASLTVVVHAIGTVRIVMPLAAARDRWEGNLTSARTVVMLTRLVGGLLVLHLAEMGVWAVAIRALAVMPTFEASLY